MAASIEQGSLAEAQIRKGTGQRSSRQGTSLVKRMSRRLSRTVKPKLSEEEINFISEQTGLEREKLLENYKRFLRKHPSGKLDFSGRKTAEWVDTRSRHLGVGGTRLENLRHESRRRNRLSRVHARSQRDEQGKRRGQPSANLSTLWRERGRTAGEGGAVQGGGRAEEGGAVEEEDLVATAFTEMDANMDGSISQEEFVSACLRENQGSASKTLALTVVEIFVENWINEAISILLRLYV